MKELNSREQIIWRNITFTVIGWTALEEKTDEERNGLIIISLGDFDRDGDEESHQPTIGLRPNRTRERWNHGRRRWRREKATKRDRRREIEEERSRKRDRRRESGAERAAQRERRRSTGDKPVAKIERRWDIDEERNEKIYRRYRRREKETEYEREEKSTPFLKPIWTRHVWGFYRFYSLHIKDQFCLFFPFFIYFFL